MLGSMLLDRASIAKAVEYIGDRGEEFFHYRNNASIYKAIADTYASGQEVSMVTLPGIMGSEWMQEIGGSGYLASLMEAAIGVVPDSTFGVLDRKRRERIRIRTASQIKALAYDQQELGEGTVSFLDATAEIMRNDMFSGDFQSRTIRDICKELADEWETRSKHGGLQGIASFSTRLDEFTGGWVGSRLYVIAGRPGMGKTSIVLQFLDSVAQSGGRPCFISLEMPDTECAARIACQRAGVNYHIIQASPQRMEPHKWDELYDKFSQIINSGWCIVDCPGADISQIVAAVERRHSESPLSIVGIDYLQLIGGMDQNNLVRELESACRILRDLGRRLKIPILLISQLSRDVEKRKGSKRPVLSDLRDSGGIEQNADAAMFVFRKSKYDPNLKNGAENIAEIIIAKNRYGPCGVVYLMFDGPTTAFRQNDYDLAVACEGGGYSDLSKEDLMDMGIIDATGKILVNENGKRPGDRDRDLERTGTKGEFRAASRPAASPGTPLRHEPQEGDFEQEGDEDFSGY